MGTRDSNVQSDKILHWTKMATNERLLTEVRRVLNNAKVPESDLKCVSQAIYMGKDLGTDDIKLLEIDDELLKYINDGKSLTIRGAPSDFAVLCTDEETYEIKDAETSNSLLLLPNLVLPSEINCAGEERQLQSTKVVGIHHNYLELRKCNSRLDTLKKILEENTFRGVEYESDDELAKYSLNDLLEIVQCSRNQLQKALYEMQAFEINGFWRILEFDYRFNVVKLILNYAEEKAWNVLSLPSEDILNTLQEYEPKDILQQTLDWYGTKNENNAYCLDEEKICKLYAEFLLHASIQFNLEDFLRTWKEIVPDEFTPNLTHLKGLAIVDFKSKPQIVIYYPKQHLPDDVGERFKALFQKCDKWTLDEIKPYIEDCARDALDTNSLLMKYARSFKADGIQYFNSK